MDLDKAKKILQDSEFKKAKGGGSLGYPSKLVSIGARCSKVVWDDKHKSGSLYDETGKEIALVMDASSSDYKWLFHECNEKGAFLIKDPSKTIRRPTYLVTSNNVYEFSTDMTKIEEYSGFAKDAAHSLLWTYSPCYKPKMTVMDLYNQVSTIEKNTDNPKEVMLKDKAGNVLAFMDTDNGGLDFKLRDNQAKEEMARALVSADKIEPKSPGKFSFDGTETEKRALTTLFRSAREAYNTGKSQTIWHTSVSSRGRV